MIVSVEDGGAFWDDASAIAVCLREATPRIPPWFGYDERGSTLFEEITALPTYYLTRVERQLIERHAAEIAEASGGARLAELGSGSAKKTRLLLQACAARGPITYLPVDVSREMLVRSATELPAAVPGLDVIGVWGRYERALEWLHESCAEPLVVAFLGSNLGNTTPAERHALLAAIAGALRPGDGFLVSVDLCKPAAAFETCYNDPPGHTAFADFRFNHLTHLNRRFGADFRLQRFVARAHYDIDASVVEGHLYATEAHSVMVPGLGMAVDLDEGGSINVGFSAKFDRAAFVAEVGAHGLALQADWVEPDPAYGIFLFRRG